jgi:hypothetical protein
MGIDDGNEAWKRSQLIEALRLLAAPFSVQIDVLPSWVVAADEVALTFDDAYSVADLSEVPGSALRLLEEIEADLTTMSQRPSEGDWTLAGLEHSSTWEALRGKALAALTELRAEYRVPAIEPDAYVQSRLPRL